MEETTLQPNTEPSETATNTVNTTSAADSTNAGCSKDASTEKLPASSYGTPPPKVYLPPKPASIPKPEPAPLNPYQLQLKNHYERYGLAALLIGILGSFCFYRNPMGITYPLFIAVLYLAAYRLLPSLGIPFKKDSLFLAAAAFILAVNSCATASPILHGLNNTAQFLLGSVFLIHQCYEDRLWNIGKYLNAILRLWFSALGCLPLPFSHGIAFVKNLKSARSKNVFLVLAGLGAAVPTLFFLVCLLANADAVFFTILQNLIVKVLNPAALCGMFFLALGYFLGFYCLAGSACAMSIPKEVTAKTKKNPISAISFTISISLLYLFFCAIQIIYLFGQKSELPGGMTYSQYAREGFFELLAVAVLNLFLVLTCLKYFQKHRLLSAALVTISLCTYVMIASAGYRMLLYVGAYSLTFLRLFVLWFLVLLAVLMAGVLALIFREKFPLFRWYLGAITIAYIAFAWSFPDYQIARYNIAREDNQITVDNIDYLLEFLSADAAPAIANAEIDPRLLNRHVCLYQNNRYQQDIACLTGRAMIISNLYGIPWNPHNGLTGTLPNPKSWKPEIRSYNFSQVKARELAIQALEEGQ